RVPAAIARVVSGLWIAAAIAAPTYSFNLYDGPLENFGTNYGIAGSSMIPVVWTRWPYAALGMQLAVVAIAAAVHAWRKERRWLRVGSMTVLFALSMILVGNGLKRVVG
ncbi:MAG TPA: hypothetical protein VM841_13650, partial [Actinomycetota bacterium]|nr:hypothetical protein [Actinomycetota bacterium]